MYPSDLTATVGCPRACADGGVAHGARCRSTSPLAKLSSAVPRLARQRPVGADQCRTGAGRAVFGRAATGRRRQPSSIRKAPRRRLKGAARLQRGQADQGSQATHRGRPRRPFARRRSPLGKCPGLSRCALAAPHRAHRRLRRRNYRGKLLDWATETLQINLSIIKRTLPQGFRCCQNAGSWKEPWLGWNRPPQQRLRTQPNISRMLPLPRSSHGPAQANAKFLNKL